MQIVFMSLDLWVEFFEDLQHVRGRSRNTVLAYRRDLELFAKFLETHKDISEFYGFLQQNNLSTRSQARVISSLRTYFKFCESRGQKVPDLKTITPPRVQVGLPQILTAEDFDKLYNACQVEDPRRTKRNQITLLLLFGVGCRVSELIGLDLKDFNETEGWVSLVGKAGKQRLVPLAEKLVLELRDYIQNVRPHLADSSIQSILVNDKGHRPSRVDIWRWLAAWSARAGFEKPISPHKFRHGCATALLDAGADLRSIQMLLGHSSIQSTQIYTNVANKNMTEAVQEHHPLSRIKPPKENQ